MPRGPDRRLTDLRRRRPTGTARRDTRDMNPFKAVSEGDAAALQAALDADPSLAGSANPDGISLVRWALYQGRRDLAAVVLSHDPPLDVFDAAAVGNAERLSKVVHHDRSLASAGVRATASPCTSPPSSARPSCASVLLQVGADPAAVASGVMTVQPLHRAAASGNVEVLAAAARRRRSRGRHPERRLHGPPRGGPPATPRSSTC